MASDPPNENDQPTEALPTAEPVGHFQLLRPIGEGATGMVFLATDREIPGRRVALKLLRKRAGLSLDSLRHEAAALAALRHPHIVVVHEIGDSPRGPFLAMEHLDGGSLAEVTREARPSFGEGLRVGRDVADALRAAHAGNILHRDIKPGNLLRTADGVVKVGDFGLAVSPREAVAGPVAGEAATPAIVPLEAIAGTPGYMAPELLRGDGASRHTDQFAFGVTLHELLTGKHPFEGVPWTEVVFRGRGALDPGLPSDVRKIVERCMAAEPAQRYPGMEDVVRDLDAAIRHRDPYRRRMTRFVAVSSAALAMLVLGWIGYDWLQLREARRLNETGVAAYEAGDHEAAYRAFLAAHARSPSFAPACQNLGMLGLSEGSAVRAVTTLEECAERFPGSGEVQAGLGRALWVAGDRQGALERMRAALERGLPPERRTHVANELGVMLIELERPEEALDLMDSMDAPPADRTDGAVWRKTLGWALLECGRPERAVTTFETAIDGPLTGAPLHQALLGLARAHEAVGAVVDARKAYGRLLLQTDDPGIGAAAREGLARLSVQSSP